MSLRTSKADDTVRARRQRGKAVFCGHLLVGQLTGALRRGFIRRRKAQP
jgi:hypothetical protein